MVVFLGDALIYIFQSFCGRRPLCVFRARCLPHSAAIDLDLFQSLACGGFGGSYRGGRKNYKSVHIEMGIVSAQAFRNVSGSGMGQCGAGLRIKDGAQPTCFQT